MFGRKPHRLSVIAREEALGSFLYLDTCHEKIAAGTDLDLILLLDIHGRKIGCLQMPGKLHSITWMDLDKDGIEKIIACSEHNIQAFNVSGEVIWSYGDDEEILRLDTKGENLIALTWDGESIRLKTINLVKGVSSIKWTEQISNDRGNGKIKMAISNSGTIGILLSHELRLFNRDGYEINRVHVSICSSENYRAEWCELVFVDLNGDGEEEILLGSTLGIAALSLTGIPIWIWNPYLNARSDDLPYELCRLEVGDVDGDGFPEIAANSVHHTLLLNGDGELVWKRRIDPRKGPLMIIGGRIVTVRGEPYPAVIMLDAKGRLTKEINVIGEVNELKECGNGILIGSDDLKLISEEGEELWRIRGSGPKKIYKADFGGGGEEILIGSSGRLTAYSKGLKKIWERETGTIYEVGICKSKELIALTCLDGSVHLLNGRGGLIWTIRKGDKGIRFVSFQAIWDDLNGDGDEELILGHYTGPYVFDAKGRLLWRYELKNGFLCCLCTGNLGYGKATIAGFNAGIYAFNWRGELMWRYPLEERGSGARPITISAEDLNGDGIDEILFISEAELVCLRDRGQLLWREKFTPGERKHYISHEVRKKLLTFGDLDKDGRKEIVSVVRDVSVYKTWGERVWSSELTWIANEVNLRDINGDGRDEIVVVGEGIAVFDSSGGKIAEYGDVHRKWGGMVLIDFDDDGVSEIAAAGNGIDIFKMSA